MAAPLVTPIEREPDPGPEPTVLILFNDRQGPAQVVEIISIRHSFIDAETWETQDEGGRPAFLLAVWCETADAEGLFDLIGSRLPDYIQARRFPPTRLAHVRASGSRLD